MIIHFLSVKANASAGAKHKLTETELLSQMQYVPQAFASKFIMMQGSTESSFSRATRRQVNTFSGLYHYTEIYMNLANSLSWALLELSRNPDIQRKLRSEIRAMAQVIQDRGDEAFSSSDFEKMSYLTAVVKVVTPYTLLTPTIDQSTGISAISSSRL